MAEKFVRPLAEAIRTIDGNRYPVEDYMWFGWEDLQDASGFKVLLSESQKQYIMQRKEQIKKSTNVKCN